MATSTVTDIIDELIPEKNRGILLMCKIEFLEPSELPEALLLLVTLIIATLSDGAGFMRVT